MTFFFFSFFHQFINSFLALNSNTILFERSAYVSKSFPPDFTWLLRYAAIVFFVASSIPRLNQSRGL